MVLVTSNLHYSADPPYGSMQNMGSEVTVGHVSSRNVCGGCTDTSQIACKFAEKVRSFAKENTDLLRRIVRLIAKENRSHSSRVIIPFPGQLTIKQREKSGKGVLQQKNCLYLLENICSSRGGEKTSRFIKIA